VSTSINKLSEALVVTMFVHNVIIRKSKDDIPMFLIQPLPHYPNVFLFLLPPLSPWSFSMKSRADNPRSASAVSKLPARTTRPGVTADHAQVSRRTTPRCHGGPRPGVMADHTIPARRTLFWCVGVCLWPSFLLLSSCHELLRPVQREARPAW